MKKILYYIVKTFICCIILICLILVAYELEHKKAKLEYVGKIAINPLSHILERHWALVSGKRIKKHFTDIVNLHKMYGTEWDDALFIDEQAYYAISFGYEIEEITYYYHSKYTNGYNDLSLFEINTVKLNPINKNEIIIYRCDVYLRPPYDL